jgi:hypothetical protein
MDNNRIIIIVVSALFIILIAFLFSKKLKEIILLIKEGLKEEFTTTAGAICFTGVIVIFILAFFSEARCLLNNMLSPEKGINQSETIYYYGAIITFLGNLWFLGYIKSKS